VLESVVDDVLASTLRLVVGLLHEFAGPCLPRRIRSDFGSVVGLSISAGAALAVFEPEAIAVHLWDVNVVGEAIERASVSRSQVRRSANL